MTIEELLEKLDGVPDDWEIAPYGQFQGMVNVPWVTLLVAHFKRHYRYRNPKKAWDYTGELAREIELDQVVVYAQPPNSPWFQEREHDIK